MNYFKVVSVYKGALESVVAAALPEDYAITYKPGEWATGHKDSGLFVFSDYDAACKFAREGDEIWGCECKGPMPTPTRVLVPHGDTFATELDKFWDKETFVLKIACIKALSDTLVFRQVKLISKKN